MYNPDVNSFVIYLIMPVKYRENDTHICIYYTNDICMYFNVEVTRFIYTW